jgi:carbonic anhydrase
MNPDTPRTDAALLSAAKGMIEHDGVGAMTDIAHQLERELNALEHNYKLLSAIAKAGDELRDQMRAERDRLNAEVDENDSWMIDVLNDFRITFDNHKHGRRIALTQWMAELRHQSSEQRTLKLHEQKISEVLIQERDQLKAEVATLHSALNKEQQTRELATQENIQRLAVIDQLKAEVARLGKVESDNYGLRAELERLKAEVEALKRGEFICAICGLRKDSDHQKADF